MSEEEIYSQSRRKIDLSNLPQNEAVPNSDPLEKVRAVREAIDEDNLLNEMPSPTPPMRPMGEAPFQLSGNIPPQLQQMMKGGTTPQPQFSQDTRNDLPPPKMPSKMTPPSQLASNVGYNEGQMSNELSDFLNKLNPFCQWEPVELPSKGRFYENIPGVLHVRPMSGNEENIFAQPRHVRQGRAIDMIFSQCIKEKIPTENLLTIDRDYLVIFLRGISYTPEYDADITCVECGSKYNKTFNLNELMVEPCAPDFTQENLFGVLPTTGFMFKYRFSTGRDEQEVKRHRDMRFNEYGDQADDDTSIFRLAQLLEWIRTDEKSAPISDKNDLMFVLRKLPINDVSHLRLTITEPPFGVDRELGEICPRCGAFYKVDLPVDIDFFFPRKKKEKTPQ